MRARTLTTWRPPCGRLFGNDPVGSASPRSAAAPAAAPPTRMCDAATGACCKPPPREPRVRRRRLRPLLRRVRQGHAVQGGDLDLRGVPVETKAEFCQRQQTLGRHCGTVVEVSACTGETRTEDCGGCDNGRECAADNTAPRPASPRAGRALRAYGKDCGELTGEECGEPRTVDCGPCVGGTCTTTSASCAAYEGRPGLLRPPGPAAAGSAAASRQGRLRGPPPRELRHRRLPGLRVLRPGHQQVQDCEAESDGEFCARLALAGLRCGTISTLPTTAAGAQRGGAAHPCGCGGQGVPDTSAWTRAPPANEGCGSAQSLASGPRGGGGHPPTLGPAPDLEGGCGGGSGPDLVYRFAIARDRRRAR
jgi:hypothetical protein